MGKHSAAQRLTSVTDRVFSAYARFSVRYSVVIWLVGVALAVAFGLGVLTAKIQNRDLDALWVDLDSRLQGEEQSMEETFGGRSRTLSVIVSARSLASGAAVFDGNDTMQRSNNALDVMMDAMKAWSTVNFTYQNGTYTKSDVCERSIPPLPYQPRQSLSTLYQRYSDCMGRDRSSIFNTILYPGFRRRYSSAPPNFTPLPGGWGIAAMPCNRASVLDCFKEGEEVDYPESLRQLDLVSGVLSNAATTTFTALLTQVSQTQVTLGTVSIPVSVAVGQLVPCWFLDAGANLSCLAAAPGVTLNNPQAYAASVLLGVARLNASLATVSPALIQQASAILGPQALMLDALSRSPTTTIGQVQAVANNTQLATLGLLQAGAQMSSLLATVVSYINLSERAQLESPTATVGGQCMATAVQEVLGISNPLDQRALSARAQLHETALFLSSVGYWWRPSYRSMTQAQIVEHFNKAANAQLNPSVRNTAGGCITIPNVTCCQTFSGSFIGTSLLVTGKAKAAGRPVPGSNRTSLDLENVALLQSGWNDYNYKSPIFHDLLHESYPTVEWSSGDNTKDFAEAFDDALTVQWLKLYNREVGTPLSQPQYADLRVDFSTGVSFPDLLEDGTKLEGHIIGLSYGVMVALVILSLGNYIGTILKIGNLGEMQLAMVNSHGILGLLGLAVIAAGCVGGIGFASYVRVTLNALTLNIAPFVSLGLGIDDMFVLAHTMILLYDRSHSIEDNIRETLCLAGPSVCLTSFANAAAFILIYYVPIAAVRQLVLVLMISVLINLLFLFLIFVPMMIWDLKRTHANRLDVIFITASRVPEEKTSNASNDNQQSLTGMVIDKVYAPMLANNVVKCIVMLAFAGFLAFTLYSAISNTRQGLQTSDVALTDTYQRDLAILAEAEFPIQSANLLQRARAYNFSDPRAQQQLLNALDAIDESPWLVNGGRIHDANFLSNGTTSILAYYNRLQSAGALGSCPPANVSTPISVPMCYNQFLPQWYGAVGSLLYPFLHCADSSGRRVPCAWANATVTAARTIYYADRLAEHNDYLDAIRDVRNRADPYNDANVEVVSVGFMFNFWEQYFGIVTTLIAVRKHVIILVICLPENHHGLVFLGMAVGML